MADDVDLICLSMSRSNRSSPRRRRAIALGLAAAAFALAGCNANQGVDVAARTAPGVEAGPYYPGYNPYDPTKYAQTSGYYAGR